MYNSVESFIIEYQVEAENTQKLLDSLTDESLKVEVASGYRTLGALAWHLVPSGGLFKPTGLKFEAPAEGSTAPASASSIAEAYRTVSQAVIEAVRSQWTDEHLQQSVVMFGQPWKHGFTLAMFLRHEIHHRGQLTVLMHQAGLPAIGIYGPTKQEWIAMGMKAPV
jgi:uncharacterized damage-inducible protein DinB